jgi:hypothetical protein
MSDLYVDPFYWEFGYAVGDQNLQLITAVPSNVTAVAQGRIGSVKSLFAELKSSDGAGVNVAGLNTVPPAELPSQSLSASSSGSLEVFRIIPVAGSCTATAAASAALKINVKAVASIQGVTQASATVGIAVNMAAAVTCAATTSAIAQKFSTLSATATSTAAATAAAAVGKSFTASLDSVITTSAIALLGKRLGGNLQVAAISFVAGFPVIKPLAASAIAVSSVSGAAGIGKPIVGATRSVTSVVAIAAVGKRMSAQVSAVANATGGALLIRLVPLELIRETTYDLQYSFIYADVEVVYYVNVETPSAPTFTVEYSAITAYPEYTELNVEAELVEDIELTATW